MTELLDGDRLRRLIALVVEDFEHALTHMTSRQLSGQPGDGQPGDGQPGELSGLELGVLAMLRESFIMGGVERIESLHRADCWLQVGLRFASRAQRERFLAHSGLREHARRWLAEERIEHLYFMNKPPGMRLRLCGPRLDGIADELQQFLALAGREQWIAGHEFGVYDQETYQFGGPAGMKSFHRFSTADSLAIMELHRAWAAGEQDIDAMSFSLMVLSDLIRKVCGDNWEQWDLWCNMELAQRDVAVTGDLRASVDAALEANRPMLEALVFVPDEVLAQVGERERAIATEYFASNTGVAEALTRAARAAPTDPGRLLYGIRKIVPFYIIFHWNRLGFPMSQQLLMALLMRALLDPKGEPPA